ncbi:MAG: hypothetical protein ACI35Q_09505 [Marinilabiliaceae bacterium]
MLEQILNYGAFVCSLVICGGLLVGLLYEAICDLVRDRRGKGKAKGGGR